MFHLLPSLRAFALCLICSASLFMAPVWALPTGDWQGFVQLPDQKLEIHIKLKQNAAGEWSGSVNIPAQSAKDLPLKEISLQQKNLRFALVGVPGEPQFQGKLNSEETSFSGQFTQEGQKFKFELQRPSQAEQGQKAQKEQAQLSRVRALIAQLHQTWKTPGLAVAIVKDDQILLAEGFGLRSLEEKKTVDADTLFAIGSCTKAFTATLLASLVDEGKLDWDAPVKDYLPAFQLKDSYASEHITPRDLLTHRSGLPRHDLAWYGTSLSGPDLLAKLKYLSPSADFRARFQSVVQNESSSHLES